MERVINILSRLVIFVVLVGGSILWGSDKLSEVGITGKDTETSSVEKSAEFYELVLSSKILDSYTMLDMATRYIDWDSYVKLEELDKRIREEVPASAVYTASNSLGVVKVEPELLSDVTRVERRGELTEHDKELLDERIELLSRAIDVLKLPEDTKAGKARYESTIASLDYLMRDCEEIYRRYIPFVKYKVVVSNETDESFNVLYTKSIDEKRDSIYRKGKLSSGRSFVIDAEEPVDAINVGWSVKVFAGEHEVDVLDGYRVIDNVEFVIRDDGMGGYILVPK